ncbi:MAG TPA: 2-oxoacid:ferredoxin oxidoreductase subunit beta [Clostridiales bacterium]|jgi:2-oxoglutarate ferredoxin oxidoreductase subunit beta|nr:2-oxoacid:ferredoxin oxidoreductase subunit beta [Clostridiales bacterium]
MNKSFSTYETAWCPGCGNFSILKCLKTALEELGKDPHEVLIAAGIGQAAKTPQYISANTFCGLHGRSLPAASAAKIANEGLTVIVNTGDGDSYGEGGNHFIHAIRRNVNIAHFVHDNQIYGLTKGQSSPTTALGHLTNAQADGNINHPLNPVLLALAAGAGFVARSFCGDHKHLTAMMKEAISYKGYALLDIFQNCVSFNKINTFRWYRDRVYYLEDDFDPSDRTQAMIRAMEFGDRIPIGVFFREDRPDYHEMNNILAGKEPLVDQTQDPKVLQELMMELV